MESFHPYFAYFAQHPDWALIVVFLVALGEALIVIGLFVPSTVVLIGAGTLVGAGQLSFLPVIIATILGCIVGDQISYWAGRIYGERLAAMWPLKNYPQLLEKGEAYVREHGGKSIAIGRFIPGIKAVVPGIAGMFGMNQAFFLGINVVSGIVWAFVHVLPGVVLGQALSLAGDLSGRLLFVLVVLISILAIGGYFVRLIAAQMVPYRKAMQQHLADWAGRSNFPSLRRFGRVIDPKNPNSVLLLLLLTLGALAVVALIDLVSGLLLRHAVGNFDQSLYNFFSELRSVPGDEIFVRVTMLGDENVIYAVALVPIIWMAAHRNWRAVAAIVVTIVLARGIVAAFSFVVASPGVGVHQSDFRFPSLHALLPATVFGILAVVTCRGLSRWTQGIIVACLAMLTVAIAFSRLYLGVNWLSDVTGGILIAGILAVLFSVAVATINFRLFHPLYLLATSIVALILATGVDIQANYERRVERFQPIDKISTFTLADYLASGRDKLPLQRINLMGKPSDAFVMQWIGSLESLRNILQKRDFHVWHRWVWRDTLPYFNPSSVIADLAPSPSVHDGLRAKLTATAPDPSHPDQRLVFRAFQTNTMIADGIGPSRVYLINVSHEQVHYDLGLFTVPFDAPAEVDEVTGLVNALKADPQIEALAPSDPSGQQLVILRPRS